MYLLTEERSAEETDQMKSRKKSPADPLSTAVFRSFPCLLLEVVFLAARVAPLLRTVRFCRPAGILAIFGFAGISRCDGGSCGDVQGGTCSMQPKHDPCGWPFPLWNYSIVATLQQQRVSLLCGLRASLLYISRTRLPEAPTDRHRPADVLGACLRHSTATDRSHASCVCRS